MIDQMDCVHIAIVALLTGVVWGIALSLLIDSKYTKDAK